MPYKTIEIGKKIFVPKIMRQSGDFDKQRFSLKEELLSNFKSTIIEENLVPKIKFDDWIIFMDKESWQENGVTNDLAQGLEGWECGFVNDAKHKPISMDSQVVDRRLRKALNNLSLIIDSWFVKLYSPSKNEVIQFSSNSETYFLPKFGTVNEEVDNAIR